MQVGDKVPEFSLLDQNGTKRTNNSLKTPLVLFFYPKDDTPGCTIEACGFRDKNELFKNLGAEVWGGMGIAVDIIDFNGASQIQIKSYAPEVGKVVKVKLETSAGNVSGLTHEMEFFEDA